MADDSGSGGASTLTVAIIALASALVGGVASGVGNYFTFASKDQELKVHLVEIAIGILRADPKEDVTPARGWALDVIEKNSGVPFSKEDREALLHKPLAGGKAVYLGPNGNVVWDFKDGDVVSGKDLDAFLEAMKRVGEGVPVVKLPEKLVPTTGVR